MDEEIEDFLREHEICYDRFTFDKIFRFLLKNDFDHEEAKDVIMYNCSLSALVLQERIHNDYYFSINIEDEISTDLLALKNEITKFRRELL
ncbi:hypothetical protein [Mucilaginibacter gotjawali]|uniref:Uncharacterized protein n=2 Tax=Mucilaginibacter gotjawali TaxID=1550579 RepID=A0A839SBA3_9SPHI|nr:hypothetical protein [Mucilaginibacter gotjawali]MBB3055126.1 hypothetical protein [Mucilaginibacter gotjawali]BAU56255.1 hypothetical protein MgSA37_04452 [Mucilaginibacter gotjawali]